MGSLVSFIAQSALPMTPAVQAPHWLSMQIGAAKPHIDDMVQLTVASGVPPSAPMLLGSAMQVRATPDEAGKLPARSQKGRAELVQGVLSSQ
jgi:hypothetical protein